MKKLLILLLLFLVFAFSACHNGDTAANDSAAYTDIADNEEPSGREGGFSDFMSGQYAALMQSGKFYMEFVSYGLGVGVYTQVAVDGDDSDTRTEVMGQVSRALILDDIVYHINETTQTYTIAPVNPDTQDALTVLNDYTRMVATSKGNGPIPGFEDIDNASYNYDEYIIPADSENGTGDMILRFYMKDTDLHAIYMYVAGMDAVMQITELSGDIPDVLLELPENYTQVFTYY